MKTVREALELAYNYICDVDGLTLSEREEIGEALAALNGDTLEGLLEKAEKRGLHFRTLDPFGPTEESRYRAIFVKENNLGEDDHIIAYGKKPTEAITKALEEESNEKENPKVYAVEHHGDIIMRGDEWITENEHWIANGKRFDHPPTEEEVKEAYKEEKPK